MRSLNNIRSLFLDYFSSKDHKILPSSLLVPHNDPTLMFTNSGMVQFKNLFTGEEKRPYVKAATAQKCVRAGGKHNDLDNVGYTARHHTFFEMLGNFSFGDYFKDQAIEYSWEFLTKTLALPKDKLFVTVYHTDDEAILYWKKIAGLSDDRIIKISTNDNFWSMGDTGPCGPCTEIFYDHGDKIFGGLPGTKDEDGDRYIEIWNLVFMQFQQLEDGSRVKLPKPSIDTGMGLERLSALLQNIHNNYETDLFKNIISSTENIVKVKAKDDALISYRVIADHLRSSAFLVTDGVMPSNEGRGYVLRRIMRRAMRHIHQLGYDQELMYQLVPMLVSEMGEAYPELVKSTKFVQDVFLHEEIKFKKTLGKGMKLLTEEIKKIGNKKELEGNVAFKLYDTYGFPLDLTLDILRSKDLGVNEKEFTKCMDEQKEKARKAWAGSGETATSEIWFELYEKLGATEFLGYEQTESQGKVLAILDYKEDLKLIITNQTPFYGESGGQMGDVGTIRDEKNKEYKIISTLKFIGKIHAHICEKPNFAVGSNLSLIVDYKYRNKLRANHSATHLLHHVLREKLGDHITQKGSQVSESRLRFDISHPKSLSREEIVQIEKEVNELIRENKVSETKIMEMEEAINSGAMALFGEKYDEEVRVVKMGESVELCGGTHVKATGDIGLFKIVSENAIAAGIRRIEAVTGEEALNFVQSQEEVIGQIETILKTKEQELVAKIGNLVSEKRKLEREISELRMKSLLSGVTGGDNDEIEHVGKYNFIPKIYEDVSPKDLRNMVDSIRSRNEDNVVVAVSNYEGKSSLIIALNSAIKNLDAGKLVKLAVEAGGGSGGGGRPDVAQAGGFDFTRREEVIDKVRELIKV